MTSTNLNKSLPLSNIGPQWPGIRVLVTETGLNTVVSDQNPYGFNLGTHVGDELSVVQHRRICLESELGVSIVWLNQVHGCDVLTVIPGQRFTSPDADASLSTSVDVALAIMTADCLPVVFAAHDLKGKALGVAAAHAGWRGLHAGVLQATAKKLAHACQVPSSQIKAWMGPAIGPKSFEVGQEVADAFIQQNPQSSASFVRGVVAGKYLADIYALARLALASVGVLDVQGGGLDTFTDSRWFSHRRGQQQRVPAGRFATLIRLLPEPGA